MYTDLAIVYTLDSKYPKLKGMKIHPLGPHFIDVASNLRCLKLIEMPF